MSETDFFGGTKTKRQIPPELEQQIDQVADEAGFRHREPLREPPKRRRGTKDQLHNFTMRLSINDAETFIRWCERERISYREGFAELVRKIDRG